MAAAPEVSTAAGVVRGETLDGGIDVFRGIPFAAPPVGALRFRAPDPVEPWTGVRDATQFGRAAVQLVARPQAAGGRPPMFGGLFGAGELGIDEDCLSINVWTPSTDGQRPVLVWIHGGAFRLGTGASPNYDGAALATRGDVVVVTFNYRLGVLGFLYAPEIGAANAGLLDQVAALEWVQREIGAFGGDPAQVTIFGESAGGKSVECLLAMPRAKGMFGRAISQSTYATPMDADAAAERTSKLVAALGCDGVDGLADAPLDQLLAAAAGDPAAATLGGGPIVDGDVLPAAPVDAVAGGAAAGLDLVVGTTLDEWKLFAALRGLMAGGGGDVAAVPDEALAAYGEDLAGIGEPAEPADVAAAMATDRMFRQHAIGLAEAQARHRPTYMYLFGWKAVVGDGRFGACHGIEIPFVFGSSGGPLGRLAGSGESDEARALTATVQDAWLTFARTGSPSTAALEWPAFDESRRQTMWFDASPRVVDLPLERIRRFWARSTRNTELSAPKTS